jgi:CheY-like chemotaxis protein
MTGERRIERVLCVDDEPDIRFVLAAALQLTLGAEVATASSAGEALAYLDAHPCPDVILLDRVLSDLDGAALCSRLRADHRFARVPIVFLTARDGATDRERAMGVGATACLAKPFDPMTIGEQLRALVAGA